MKKCDPSAEISGELIKNISGALMKSYESGADVNFSTVNNLPREKEILSILDSIMELIFPGFGSIEVDSPKNLEKQTGRILSSAVPALADVIERAFRHTCKLEKCSDENKCCRKAAAAAEKLFSGLPALRSVLEKDIQAAYDGDPAAKSFDEVILSYPCIKAVTIQRIAHVLYTEKVPLIPRMMGEYAHRITAIDIHPGAKLGEGFFIDHGTGVVIGETAEIGNNVKLYQGVTLGALSFPKDACGKIIKGAKRHPTIGDNVTIYAGATILGDIVVGEGSVIGGNVWLTESVQPHTKITIAPPDLTINKSGANRVG